MVCGARTGDLDHMLLIILVWVLSAAIALWLVSANEDVDGLELIGYVIVGPIGLLIELFETLCGKTVIRKRK